MATPAQIRANRANARKSTGPRSPAGKARSSRNALKHGFRSRAPLAATDAGAFSRALAKFQRGLRPASSAESDCVQNLVRLACRLQLLDDLELALTCQKLDPATVLRKLATLARYRSKPERYLYEAIRQYEAAQASRNASQTPAKLASFVQNFCAENASPKPSLRSPQAPL